MSDLIEGDDGLPAEKVGEQTKVKHERLGMYLELSDGARRKFLDSWSRSATYIDLFCGTGRARIKETGEWVDGSAVRAWKTSCQGKAPFSKLYIADVDEERRTFAAERLRRLDAPVVEVPGNAIDVARKLSEELNSGGLHFAFIDPYNLEALDFRIVEALSRLSCIDMLIHISKMDHQRNLNSNLTERPEVLDSFVPGWRGRIDRMQNQPNIRRQVLSYWIELVERTGKSVPENWDLVTGSRGQHLYWLVLVAKHSLAKRFWKEVAAGGQRSLEF